MIELRTLVEAALRRFDCQVEAVEQNLFRAAIPADSPIRQILDVGETAYLALVQFEEDRLAGLEPVRHLVPGSIYLERFIGILTEHGAVGDAALPRIYGRPDALPVRLSLEDVAPDAGGCEVTAGEDVTHRCVTFHFIVDLFAVEAVKTLVSITYDLDARRLVANVDTSSLPDAGPAAVEIAGAELRAAAGAVLESVRAEACRQIELYADEHDSERASARRRLQRLARRNLDGGGTPEEERGEIAQNWEQRIRHADSQYRAEGAQIALVGATRQLRPFARYAVNFPARPAASGSEWEVLYDLTCGDFLPPLCRSCGSAACRLTTGEGACAHPLCARCAESRPACGHRTCVACARKCASCAATMCADCGSPCEHLAGTPSSCPATACDKHKKLCAKCGICACSRHRLFCKSCQRTFCGLCFEDHQWKQADCGHLLDCGSKLKSCRTCATTLCTFCTEQCLQCKRHACNEHSAKCSACSSTVCDKHKSTCSKCENVVCSQHRQFCKSCRRTFCGPCQPGHGWERSDCGHLIFCGSKSSACRTCKETLCAACAQECGDCGRTACHKHAGRCLACRLRVCVRCAGPGCEACRAACCREHSFSCKVCARPLCYEHSQWCAVCKRAVCDAHATHCRKCLSPLCQKHGQTDELMHCMVCEGEAESLLWPCDRCHKGVPPKLLVRGGGDPVQLICIECSVRCAECDTWSPEFGLERCAACGIILCAGCLEEHFYSCNLRFEELPG
jgi:hypothetical protein